MSALLLPSQLGEAGAEDLHEELPAQHERELEYRGYLWTVLAGVFAPYPAFTSSSGITPKNIAMYRGKRVLDLGCGSGVRGIIAKMSGAAEVMAIDISPTACRNTQINAVRRDVRVKIICADMFSAVAGKFDTIVSYLPSRDRPVERPEHRCVHDPGFRLNRQLIREAPNYLIPGGILHTSFLDQQGSVHDRIREIYERGYDIASHTVSPHAATGDWHFFSLIWND